MHTLRATSILLSSLTLCAAAGAQSSDELGAPAPAPSGPYAHVPYTGSQNLAVLFDNGPFITGVGNGAGGADTSEIQAGGSTFGFNNNSALVPQNYRIADDFDVPAGQTWNLTSVTRRAYQTGGSTAGTMTGAFVQIWNGPPGGGGSVIAGDMTTNRMTGQVWSGVYRVTSTTLTNTQRPIIDLAIDMSWAPALGAGTYWLDVGLTGSLASGPWANPTVPQMAGDNALQHVSGAWQGMIDTGGGWNNDVPFIVEGTGGGGCTPPTTYCTPKLSSSGCLPSIGFTGSNSISAGTFAVAVSMAEGGNMPGIIIWSSVGPASSAFQGGTLCIAPMVNRLPPQLSGGSLGTCTGSYAQPAAASVLSTVGAGNTAWFQAWFRDGMDPFGSGLSDGLEVPICP